MNDLRSGNRKDLIVGNTYHIKNSYGIEKWYKNMKLVDIEKDWGVHTYKFVGEHKGVPSVKQEIWIDGDTLYFFSKSTTMKCWQYIPLNQ